MHNILNTILLKSHNTVKEMFQHITKECKKSDFQNGKKDLRNEKLNYKNQEFHHCVNMKMMDSN